MKRECVYDGKLCWCSAGLQVAERSAYVHRTTIALSWDNTMYARHGVRLKMGRELGTLEGKRDPRPFV